MAPSSCHRVVKPVTRQPVRLIDEELRLIRLMVLLLIIHSNADLLGRLPRGSRRYLYLFEYVQDADFVVLCTS